MLIIIIYIHKKSLNFNFNIFFEFFTILSARMYLLLERKVERCEEIIAGLIIAFININKKLRAIIVSISELKIKK